MKLNWSSYPFVRLLVGLMIGILAVHFLEIYWKWLFGVLCGSIFGYVAVVYFTPLHKKYALQPILGIWAILNSFFWGIFITQNYTEKYQPTHISHHLDSFAYFEGQIVDEVLPKGSTYQVTFRIKKALKHNNEWENTNGKVMLHIQKEKNPKDTSIGKETLPFRYGDYLLFENHLQEITPPLNPSQFNFKRYLSYQNIGYQQYLKQNEWRKTKSEIGFDQYPMALAIELRQICDKILAKYVRSEQEYGIASALVLGVKGHLDEDIKQAYTNAGVTHVLAVSGMHVGIIYLILVFLFGKLKDLKYGLWIFVVFVIGILWLYALVTGLSGSVLRAVAMFSVIVFAQNFKYNTNIYNLLAISAYSLLYFNPYLLADAGFQLSYLAVWGIVYLYPKIYPMVVVLNEEKFDKKLEYKMSVHKSNTEKMAIRILFFIKHFHLFVADWIWKTIAVTVAAQIFTLPVSFYHFHLYPTYNLVANLFVIPLGNIILVLGLIILAVDFVPFLPKILGICLEYIIRFTNWIVFQIQSWDNATSVFVVGYTEAFVLGIFLGCILCFFEWRKFRYLLYATIFAIGLSIYNIWEIYERKEQEYVVIYGIPKASAIGFVKGFDAFLMADSTFKSKPARLNFNTKNHLENIGVRNKIIEKPDIVRAFGNFEVFLFKNEIYAIVSKKLQKGDFQTLKTISPQYLIVQKGSFSNFYTLKKIIDTQKSPFVSVILDASNSRYLDEKLSKQAIELKIPYYSVAQKGAWIK